MNWTTISSSKDVNQIIEASHSTPQVILKHSTTCPISSMAKMRLENKWDLEGVEAHYLDLLAHRDVSANIAEILSVHHESPQILLVINGECVYDASHFDITVDELKESLNYAQK